ncbi:hypothetical protein Btru_051702 [Bulinus truncatus]|nr:hypothetical protein Btru_051702 [Bulinus truncatus]
MGKVTSLALVDVIIRRARAEDYTDVMTFGTIYQGKDYLAYSYTEVINDPDIYAVVAEVEGQVVGFYMKQVIDGGQSVVRQASRVHPSFRKRGIMHLMGQELDRHMAEHDTHAQHIQRAVVDLNEHRVTKEFTDLGYSEIQRKPIRNFQFSIQELNITNTEYEVPSVIQLGYDDVKVLFTLDDVIERLFPMKRLFNCYVAYRCLESNIKHLVGKNKAVFATVLSPSQRTNEPNDWYHDIDMMSFSNWWMGEAGLIYCLDIYAAEVQNDLSLSAHVYTHVKVIRDLKLAEEGVVLTQLGNNLCVEKLLTPGLKAYITLAEYHQEMNNVRTLPPGDVRIRRVLAEDYNDVMSIGAFFDGRDYLAYTYHQVINDPDVYAVVAEVKGQVVGFKMKQFIDGGQSVVGRAARVHPSFRKMGIKQLMGDELDRHMIENDTDVRYIHWGVSDQVVDRVTGEYRDLGFCEIHRKPVLHFEYTVTDLNFINTEVELPVVHHFGYDDVKILITLEDVIERLFPMKRLFNCTVAYRYLESNMKYLVGENKEVFATVLSPSQSTNGLKHSYHDLDMVTFVNWWVGEAGLIYCIDIYATKDHNDLSILAHAQKHTDVIRRLQLAAKGVMAITLGDHVSPEKVKSAMRRVGVDTVITNLETMTFYFEKEL